MFLLSKSRFDLPPLCPGIELARNSIKILVFLPLPSQLPSHNDHTPQTLHKLTSETMEICKILYFGKNEKFLVNLEGIYLYVIPLLAERVFLVQVFLACTESFASLVLHIVGLFSVPKETGLLCEIPDTQTTSCMLKKYFPERHALLSG